MTRRRTARLSWKAVSLLAGLALIAGAAEIALAERFGGSPTPVYMSDVVFAVGWTLAGLVAWRIRPVSRVGSLRAHREVD